MKIGERILARRKQLNMTQDELAKKVGYKSRSSINKIELGLNDVTQSGIVKFSEALDVSIAYLMGFEELPPDPLSEKKKELIDLIKQMPDAEVEALLMIIKRKI